MLCSERERGGERKPVEVSEKKCTDDDVLKGLIVVTRSHLTMHRANGLRDYQTYHAIGLTLSDFLGLTDYWTNGLMG